MFVRGKLANLLLRRDDVEIEAIFVRVPNDLASGMGWTSRAELRRLQRRVPLQWWNRFLKLFKTHCTRESRMGERPLAHAIFDFLS